MDPQPGARPRGESHQIVAAGITVVGEGLTEEDFALVRYNDDCSIDTTFGAGGAVGDGLVVTDFLEGFDEAVDVAIQGPPDDEDLHPDGDRYKVVVVGVAAQPDPEEEDFGIARYNEDGSLDTSFGVGGDEGDGKVRTDFHGPGDDDKATGVIIVGDRIVVVGHGFEPGATGEDFALGVYHAVAAE